MTDNSEDPQWGAPMARQEHENSYVLFLSITKWTCVATALILLFLLIVVYN